MTYESWYEEHQEQLEEEYEELGEETHYDFADYVMDEWYKMKEIQEDSLTELGIEYEKEGLHY